MHSVMEYTKDEYLITTDKSKLIPEDVGQLLSLTYWANTRSTEDIVKSIDNSLCFSLFEGSKLIGLARVVTDYTSFAYLCDVIVSNQYRGKGLGSWLVGCVMQHPDLIEIKRWCLVTRDAHKLYEKHGFYPLKNPDIYMEIFKGY